MSSTNRDTVITNFPHPVITPLTERPTYHAIREIHLMLNANATSVPSNRGDGMHGLLFLTVAQAVYRATTGMDFIAPINPGIHPTIPTNPTATELAHAQREHQALQTEWQQYIATDNALKQQLLSAIPDIYTNTLRNAVTGYSRITTRDILNHLYRTYGRISPQVYEKNHTSMTQSYDPNAPFECFIKQIEDGMMIADAAGKPYTPEQIEQMGYMILEKTGVFTDECKQWRRRTTATKTWANLKTDFGIAHNDLVETGQTAGEAGYRNEANYVSSTDDNEFHQETAAALANLASATESDRATLKELASANSALTQQLTSVTASLQSALQELATIKKDLGSAPSNSPPTRYPPRRVRKYNNNNYCWSCGYDISDKHTSQTSKWAKPGHKRDATLDDNMGESQVRRHLIK